MLDGTWEGTNIGINNGDAHLHYPFTYITVHDAHTGEKVKDLGWIKRELTGTIMISDGDTYWPPLRTELWEVIGMSLSFV